MSASPCAAAERIRAFVQLYGGAPFNHASEVLSLLASDSSANAHVHVSDIALAESFRNIMRVRAQPRPAPADSPRLLDDLGEPSMLRVIRGWRCGASRCLAAGHTLSTSL
jgi:hypothetical protein